MPALPTSFPSGYEPSSDDYQAMLDLLGQLSGMPAPVSTANVGTATSGGTETLDLVLPTYQFTVPTNAATWRYEAVFNNGVANSSVVDDVYEFRIRDGGASTPTNTSTLVANGQALIHATGQLGRVTIPVRGTWIPGAGTHTLGVFMIRLQGSGVGTPVSSISGLARELFVRFQSFA